MEKSEESGQVIVTVNGEKSSEDFLFTYKVMNRDAIKQKIDKM